LKHEYAVPIAIVLLITLTYAISRLPDVVLILLAGLICGIGVALPSMVVMAFLIYTKENGRPNINYYYPPRIEPPSIVPYQPIHSEYVPGQYTVIGEDR